MPNKKVKQEPVRSVLVEMEISIDASVEKVWNALVNETTKWWPKDFYTSPKTKRYVIEPKLGGRVYEDAGNDTGLVWMTVQGLEPPRHIYMVGHIRPPFGGPAVSMLNYNLTADGKNKTKLVLSDAVFGQISDKMSKSLDEGWRYLMEQFLKPYAQKKKGD